ncbi:Ig-like domain-containing protein [uncultured Gordonia sp.]|uniref:Ig-like domain-containing protein n=1 Tax=uncultured Gordonia sp. TaxID=198437 RepID=UPI00262AD9C3|nr:Ig-like domain-containing protein [uncultured Gordonia sp.]
MRISHRNRARLVAAAAGISLLLNPGQAAADDDAGSPAGAASQSDTGGGSGDSGPEDSGRAAEKSSTSTGSGGESSAGGGSASVKSSGGGDTSSSETSSDSGISSDSQTSGDNEVSADSTTESGSNGGAPVGDDEPPGGTAATQTTETESTETGATETATTTKTTAIDTTPAAAEPATGNPATSGGGTVAETTTEKETFTPPTTATTDTTSFDSNTSGPSNFGPGSPETTESNSSESNSSSTGTTEPSDPPDTPATGQQARGMAALTTTVQEDDAPETTAEPSIAPTAFFSATTTTTTAPQTTTSAPLAGLLTFLGIPPVGGPTTNSVAVSPAPWTLLWWIPRPQPPLTNQPPTAAPTLQPTTDGYTISLNATDPDGDPLTTTITTAPTNGTATVNGDGTITYAHNPGSTAADQFTVKLSDSGPHLHGLASILGLFTGQNPHNRYVTVNVPESTPPPTNSGPTIILSAPSSPAASTGVATGTISVADADNDPLTITVTGGTSAGPNTFTTSGGGTLFIDPAAGIYTYTPSLTQRLDASRYDATADHTTETITVVVDDGRGGTNFANMTTQIAPITMAGDGYLGPRIGPDGTIHQLTYTLGSSGVDFYLASTAPTGTTTTPIPGNPVSDIVTGNGVTYLSTWTVDESTGDQVYSLISVAADGTVRSTSLPGYPRGSVQLAPDGTAYLSSTTTDDVHVTQLAVDGTTTTTTLPGVSYEGVQVGPTGTAYQTTLTYDSASDEYATHITVFAPGQAPVTYAVAGLPANDGVRFRPDGTAIQTIQQIDSGVATTYVLMFAPNGGITPIQVTGEPFDGARVAPDGTVYQTTYQSVTGQTYVTKIAPNGAVTVVDFAGIPGNAIQIGPNGTAYQLSRTGDASDPTWHLTRITPSGNTIDLNGAPILGTQIAPDGTAYVITGVGSWPPDLYLTTITPAGIATVSATITGYLSGNVAIRSDGTAYYTTYTDGPGGTVTTHVHIIGTTTVIDIPGQPSGGVYVAPDGSVLQSVSSGGVTRLVVIAPAPVV